MRNMNVIIIANGSQEAFDWLDQECQVAGHKPLRFIKKVKVWHYDVLPISADRGVIMKVYEVAIGDDCQNHLSRHDFMFMPELKDNYEFIIPDCFRIVNPCAEVTEFV